MGNLFFQWPTGCTEVNVIAHISNDKLEALVVDSDDVQTQPRLSSLVDRSKVLEPEADFPKHDFATVAAVAGNRLRSLIVAAASGDSAGAPADQEKTWKKHGKRWFKSFEGGRELADQSLRAGRHGCGQTPASPVRRGARGPDRHYAEGERKWLTRRWPPPCVRPRG